MDDGSSKVQQVVFACKYQKDLQGNRIGPVSIGKEIIAGEALESPGQILMAMLPILLQTLHEACPKFDLAAMHDAASEFAPNEQLACWEGDGLIVKACIRVRVAETELALVESGILWGCGWSGGGQRF